MIPDREMYRAMRELAGHCDGARALDGQGFSKSHASIGAYLAETDPSRWSGEDRATAWYLCQFHHRQLEHYGVTIPPEEKDEAAWQVTLRRAQQHAKRPVRTWLGGQGSQNVKVNIEAAKGKTRHRKLTDLTWEGLLSLVPESTLEFSREQFEAERFRLTGLTWDLTPKAPYNATHRAEVSLCVTGPAEAVQDFAARLSVPVYHSSRAIELAPTETSRQALEAATQAAAASGLHVVMLARPEAVAQATKANRPYADFAANRHNLYWEAGQGGMRLKVYGPYVDHWTAQARAIPGRFWNGAADEFPASSLPQVLALLEQDRTYAPPGTPYGVSHLTSHDLAEIEVQAGQERVAAQAREAVERRASKEAERQERERIHVTVRTCDDAPHARFDFPYDPARQAVLKRECHATYARVPRAEQNGWYAPLTPGNLRGIERAAQLTGLKLSPELQGMIRTHCEGEHDRAQQAQVAILLIDTERGGGHLPAPAVPGLGSALKRHQRLPPLVWPHTRRMLLADEQGLGKSIEAISIMLLEHARAPLRAVVVCPTNLTDNWHAESAEHAPGALTSMTARSRTPSAIPEGVNVVVIGWDVLGAWQPTLSAWQPQVLTIDEGQLGKSGGGEWGSQRGAAAQLLAASVRAGGGGVMVLTGTPIDTRPLDALALFQMLAVDEVFGTPKTFKETYCGPRQMRVQVPVKVGKRTVYERRQITTYKGASNTAQLHALLARQPWYVRRTKKLLIEQDEMQPKTVNGVDWYDYEAAPSPDLIELSAEWQAAYDVTVTQFAQYVMALLAEEHPEWGTLTDEQIVGLLERKLANVLPKLTLMRQVLGAAKIDAVCERALALNAAGEQVVVIAHHREVVDEYSRRLCRGRELKIQGGMSTREVEAVKRHFNSHGAADAPVIVLSQDAAKLGHTLCLQHKLAGLPECAHVLIAEEGYNPGPEAQAMDRIWRIPNTRAVTVTNVIARGTLDEGLFALRRAKRLAAAVITDGEAVDGDANLSGLLSGWLRGLDFREAAEQAEVDTPDNLEAWPD